MCPLKENWFLKFLSLILLFFTLQTNVSGQCVQKYEWAVWNNFTGNSATGTIKQGEGDISMEIKANYTFSSTNGIFNYPAFRNFQTPIPNQQVPRTNWSAGTGGETTMCFSEVVTNPVLLLSSIGRPNLPVTLELSLPFRPIYDGGGMTFVNDSTIIGKEGFTILLFPGEFQCITIFSSTPEYYTNLTWGLNPPLFSVDLEGELQACESTTITASGGDTYKWTGGQNPDAATNTFTTSGRYFLTVTDPNDCEVTTSVFIQIGEEYCEDCAGTINGNAVTDDCGVCLEPTDPSFNLSCVDCAGTVNGAAVLDDCQACLEPTDPSFNQSCFDCNGTKNGTSVLDDCGVCQEPTDPSFNQSCLDCSGTINGTAVIDDCGVCLEPTDPSFNLSCVDCAGTINGAALLDDCQVCLEPTDPSFNQSCLDCAGTINGTAVIDDCEVCLEPTDPFFNSSCIGSNVIRIPDAFTPNGDGRNDTFEVVQSSDTEAKILSYSIFNRWGELIYYAGNFDFHSGSKWWDGKVKGKWASAGNYAYYIEVEFQNGEIKRYKGRFGLIL